MFNNKRFRAIKDSRMSRMEDQQKCFSSPKPSGAAKNGIITA
jgi:hypothetical protein